MPLRNFLAVPFVTVSGSRYRLLLPVLPPGALAMVLVSISAVFGPFLIADSELELVTTVNDPAADECLLPRPRGSGDETSFPEVRAVVDSLSVGVSRGRGGIGCDPWVLN